MKALSTFFIGSVFLVGMANVAQAKVIGDHGAWLSFLESEQGKPACIISSKPKKSIGKYKSRGPIFAVIAHRPFENRIGEFSFQAGYGFKKSSEVSVVIDGKSNFKLFTKGEHAWTRDSAHDQILIKAMRQGNSMIIKGISSRGTHTTDVFSLKGFTAAILEANAACKIK